MNKAPYSAALAVLLAATAWSPTAHAASGTSLFELKDISLRTFDIDPTDAFLPSYTLKQDLLSTSVGLGGSPPDFERKPGFLSDFDKTWSGGSGAHAAVGGNAVTLRLSRDNVWGPTSYLAGHFNLATDLFALPWQETGLVLAPRTGLVLSAAYNAQFGLQCAANESCRETFDLRMRLGAGDVRDTFTHYLWSGDSVTPRTGVAALTFINFSDKPLSLHLNLDLWADSSVALSAASQPVPEPAVLALMLGGLSVLGAARARRI